MIIKVIKPLNTRIGGAGITYKKDIVRQTGEEIEVTEKVIGQSINGNNVWYFDGNEKYYWSGGVIDCKKKENQTNNLMNFEDYKKININGKFLINNIDYGKLLNIDIKYKSNTGNNINIGVLDHFINKDLPFLNSVILSNAITTNNPPHSHGCAMAGLIAGNNGIFGVAKSSTIIELPIYDLNGYMDDAMITNALNYFSSNYAQKISILNISQVIPKKHENEIRNIAANKNLIIIAAAGTNNELLKDELQFPSSVPNVISVGSISSEFYNNTIKPNFNKELDIVMPDFNYLTYTKNIGKYDYFGKDSAACAVVSGIISLLISSMQNASISEIKNELQKLLIPYSSGFEILKTINPINPKL